MAFQREKLRSRFSWAKPREAANQRRGYVQSQDEGAVYRGRLHGRRLRLLRLLPESQRDSLMYDLDEYGLDSGIKFEALSYSWGDPTQKHSIWCNGKEVQIAENLYNALQQFQEDGDHHFLWTDALSINQSDLDEKSEQVKLMADIYKAASEVIVWLDKEIPSDRSGVALLTLLMEKLGLPKYFKDLAPDPRFKLLESGLPESGDPQWMDVLGVFKRAWFVRAWTVQEFLFARRSHLRIGGIRITWDQLFAAPVNSARYSSLHSTIWGPRVANRELNNVKNLWFLKVRYAPFVFAGTKVMTNEKPFFVKTLFVKAGLSVCTGAFKVLGLMNKVHMPYWSDPKPSLEDLLTATSGHEVTNSLDQVFSILSLAHDGRVDKIDYRKDIAQVLVDAAKMSLGIEDDFPYISLGASIRFLTCIEVPSTIPGVPSWVPDYNVHEEFSALASKGKVSLTQPTLGNVNGICDKNNVLHLRGRFIDMIDMVYQSQAHEHRLSQKSSPGKPLSDRDIVEIYANAPDLTRDILSFEEQCWKLATSLGTYPTGEILRDAYWRTLICDTIAVSPDFGVTMKECFEAYCESLPLIALLPWIWAEHSRSVVITFEGEPFLCGSFLQDIAEAQLPEEVGSLSSTDSSDISFTLTADGTVKAPATSVDKVIVPAQAVRPKFPIATSIIGDLPTVAHSALDTPPVDPVADQPVSRSSTPEEVLDQLPAENTAWEINANPEFVGPATPEMFTSRGMRVPQCIYDEPGRTVIDHFLALSVKCEIFERYFSTYSFGRRFSTTKSGYMGWMPRAAMQGDLVCVFNGISVPFVVRPLPDGTCMFLGACYMHGLMKGRAFKLEGKPECTIMLR